MGWAGNGQGRIEWGWKWMGTVQRSHATKSQRRQRSPATLFEPRERGHWGRNPWGGLCLLVLESAVSFYSKLPIYVVLFLSPLTEVPGRYSFPKLHTTHPPFEHVSPFPPEVQKCRLSGFCRSIRSSDGLQYTSICPSILHFRSSLWVRLPGLYDIGSN